MNKKKIAISVGLLAGQTSLLMGGVRRAEQVPADTLHDMNDKKISELTKDEYKQVREEWDVHFNDLDFRDGRFKVVLKGEVAALRFHDKVDAIKVFYAHYAGATLYEGKRILMTRDK